MEAYHITIRGPSLGGTDGIDVACTDNCYLHDIEVTNRDECISVKSPSQNVLIEDVYCNQSGGMSIGSLTANGKHDILKEEYLWDFAKRKTQVSQPIRQLQSQTSPCAIFTSTNARRC
jgi:hypothetical protein